MMKLIQVKIVLLIVCFYGVVLAKDFGVLGQTWKIVEQDAAEMIRAKLNAMAANKELEKHNALLSKKLKHRLENPVSIALPIAQEYRRFYYDPSLELPYDILDIEGRVIYRAQDRINPLDYVKLSAPLVFLDGNDDSQLEYALSCREGFLVLVSGSPIKLEDRYGRNFYMDQDGLLIKRFSIKNLPALVQQVGDQLQIEEVVL